MHFAKRAPLAVAFLALGAAARAQSIDDGVMLSKKSLFTGFVYMHDGWDEYWEGTLKRANGNVGTLTTQSVTWSGNYGITDRLNVIAMAPYVWTEASAGPVHGYSGLQDFTAALKFNALETPFTGAGFVRAIAVASASVPMTDYIPEGMPLTIGQAASRVSARSTLHFEAKQGWFLEGTAAYTWRGKVTLDRPAYFTDGHLYLSDEVALPDVFDYMVTAGYSRPGLMVPISFSQQSTLGGGDIRRQDAPFSSNRMNHSKLGAVVMYTLPPVKNLTLRLAGHHTLSGRNVGQSNTVTAGLLYTFHF